MSTKMTRFGCFSEILLSCALVECSLGIGRVKQHHSIIDPHGFSGVLGS